MSASGRDHTRILQLVFVGLFAVSVAQVTFWILDQVSLTADLRARFESLYQQDLAAARLLVASGEEARHLAELFPHLVYDPKSAELQVDPALSDELERWRYHRLNRVGWEGAFFLGVLIAGIAVLARALRHDSELRLRQRNFLAAVSHELKTPLASLQLAAETLALRDPEAETRERLVTRMLTDVKRLTDMVTNILETSRLEAGRIELAPESVPLARAVTQAIEDVQGAAPRSDVVIESRVPDALHVEADPIAVRSVLVNLIDNAVKATAAAGGGRISILAARHENSVELSVSDSGIGFPTAEAARLFERFYRPGSELRRELRGSGLGLYIVRRFVDMSGGQVSAHSDGPGQGATFRVSFRSAREPAP